MRLGEHAKARLGRRFDIKAVHEVLKAGRLPPVVLAEVVKTRLA